MKQAVLSLESELIIDGIVELKLKGQVDGSTAQELESFIKKILAGGVNRIIVNIVDLEYISSAGLAVFMSAQEKVNGNEGGLVIIPSATSSWLFGGLLGIRKSSGMLDCAADREDAVRKLSRRKDKGV